jgi:prophage DNA circulation protein
MSWKEKLLPASWRNVPFGVDTSDLSGGRRTSDHSFPERDGGYTEDHGRDRREFSLQGYVLGPDYMTGRDALIDACELGGSGVLVHPYYGKITAKVTNYRVHEESASGGIAIFTLTFKREEFNSQPIAATNTSKTVTTAANSSLVSSRDSFANSFSVTSKPSFILDDAKSKLGAATAAIRSARTSLKKSAEFAKKLSDFSADLDTLLSDPAELALRVIDLIGYGLVSGDAAELLSTAAGTITEFRELMKLFAFGENDTQPIGTTPADDDQRTNQNAINGLVQQGAVCLCGHISSKINYSSFDEALRTLSDVTNSLDDICDNLQDDSLYSALRDLKVAIVKDIDSRASNLSRIQAMTLPQATPSVVLAYRLYGSTDMEQDIIDRNGISNPCFVPGGVPLEVLSND